MNLELSGAEREFQQEVRNFFAAHPPPGPVARIRAGLRPETDAVIAYQRSLAQQGWGAPTWPKEYGGTGWTPTQIYIFQREAARADAPAQYQQGLELIGPLIFTYGTAAQKAQYLPRIIWAEDWWCQGYSEPGAGSDLASLRTRAVRTGDHYLVSGQKMWTSYAHVATHMFTLVRTSIEARKQAGITLLLIDMNSPGISIRPVITLDELHHTNEVFLDEVRVPIANLLGEEGQGWSYGKVLLDRERALGAGSALRITQQVRAVQAAARRLTVGGVALIDDSSFRTQLAQLEIETIGIDMMAMRLIADLAAGIDSGARASMLKLRWSELTQRIAELWINALGYDAAVFQDVNGALDYPSDMPAAMQGALYSRLTSIYSGASEIQKNIIARRLLGL